MTAIAVKERSIDNQLPLISNGKLVALKESQPYHGNLCTTLPPLPTYTVRGVVRTRWGVDEDIGRLSNGTHPSRINFFSCHPVSEDPTHLKYEGYMFPKPVHQDITVQRNSLSNTSRRVPRHSNCEMFPRHNPSRLQDEQYILGESTRRSIEENIIRLYRTARYNTVFKDTSRFMLAKDQRDMQFLRQRDPLFIKSPTCQRIFNHPFPCPHCWYGGCNNDSDTKPSENKYMLCTPTQPNQSTSSKLKTDIESASKYDFDFKQASNNNLETVSAGSDDQKKICNCLKDTCRICSQTNDSFDTKPEQTHSDTKPEQTHSDTKPEQTHSDTKPERTYSDKMGINAKCDVTNITGSNIVDTDTFGPWQDNTRNKISNDEIVTHGYQHKLPASFQCKSTHNEHTTQGHDKEGSFSTLSPRLTQTTYNSWTFRDDNNLRIPCIVDIIGSSSKSDAHKRYHLEHPESVPDLRDHRRYSRRVKFNGISSSVYR